MTSVRTAARLQQLFWRRVGQGEEVPNPVTSDDRRVPVYGDEARSRC
jgi:hypothetical protein